jgi:phosphoribosyl-ATP pyrophosphohydrolase/phosphoribosyl-AMP cyclohydrolase/histidinol dehydrogenase
MHRRSASLVLWASFLALSPLAASPVAAQVHYHEGGQPWNQRAGSGPDAEVPGWYYNLGITGTRAELVAEAPKSLVVRHVFAGTPASGVVLVGDHIVGAMGKPFREAHRNGYGEEVFGATGPIEEFASALEAAQERTASAAGGRCGHSVVPVASAGCYAPGGRYPLPSSVLMTATTARVAGVSTVWAASPRPTAITLAAAAISGCDALLAVGGAQAIAALAMGAGPVPAVDMIVGPGNRWVTAAKWLLSREVGIDMLAGPSELLILADASADPVVVAADLIAQAEHDADAIPMLATTDPALPARVDRELARQLATLPGAATARAALANGFAIIASSEHELVEIADALAPEHLEVMTADASALARRCSCYGAVFIGQWSAEVFGDYGIGPNHVLPTGRTARFSAGLSVLTFLKQRTWVELDEAPSSKLIGDTAALARLEGLEGHARASEFRA